ncbi:hypothetical protein BH10PAT2_BH10PAT2_1390 [soil metagenome]
MSARPQKFWKKLLLLMLLGVLATGILFFLDKTSLSLSQPKIAVVIIGDSNSDPNSITQVQKWSSDYAMAHKSDAVVFNLAIGGHAVEDFDKPEELALIQKTADMIPRDSKVIVITLLGTNNAIMTEKFDNNQEFTTNYNQFLGKVRVILKPNFILIGSIPPSFPSPSNSLTTYTPNFKAYMLIEQYNQSLASWVAEKAQIGTTKLGFVEILPADAYQAKNINTYLIPDGIHLNRASQIIIFHRVDAAVQTYLDKDAAAQVR